MFEFSLPGIDIKAIDQKYDISVASNIPSTTEIPSSVTKIENLNDIKEIKYISFLDEMKNNTKCNISMIDYKTHESCRISPKEKKDKKKNFNYCCFWCRHPFETHPIGCPIDFVNDVVNKNYYSEITKDKYNISQSVILSDCIDNISNDTRITYDINSYYITDGIFCSFNCVKSYIRKNTGNIFYSKSKMFLAKLYKDYTNGESIKDISYAPDWRMLSCYGGNLSIEAFREGFLNTEYNYHGIVKEMKSICRLYEKRFRI